MSKYKQGIFIPRNKEKYRGHWPARYRSSLELKFMQFCDFSSAIIYWGCESLVVEYLCEARGMSKHLYIVDFSVVIREKTGSLQKYFIEIKPSAQTVEPVRGKKKEATYLYEVLTWLQNKSKWKAAQEYANTKGAKFIMVTEKDLYGIK